MASFFDTTIGQQVEFQRVLASAGFTDSDIARIIKEPNLASAMYGAIQPKPTVLQTPIPTDIVARVKRQLARYEEAGFVIDDELRQQILAQAAAFVPLSATDRPLVTGFFGCTPEAINQVWSKVKLDGYETVRYFDQDTPIRFAPGMQPVVTQPRLVHFEPNSYQGKSPESALKQAKKDDVQLAGIEVAEILFVEPEWALEWDGTDHPFPNASALQLKFDQSWSYVPYLGRWDDDRRLRLDDDWAGDRYDYWSSPSVREC